MPRLLSVVLIAAFTLAATACWVNAVPEEGASEPALRTARFETVSRTTWRDEVDDSETRVTGIVDFGRDRSETREENGLRTITIGLVSYTELPADVEVPAGKRWARFDASEFESWFMKETRETAEEGVDVYSVHVFSSSALSEPNRYLDYLRAVGSELDEGSEDVIRGVSTTHYRVTLDNRKVWRHELTQAGWSAGAIERFVAGVGAETSSNIDVWIDRYGRVLRVVSSDISWTSSSDRSREEEATSLTTTEYFDFGAAVDIRQPPDDEVIESDELPERQE